MASPPDDSKFVDWWNAIEPKVLSLGIKYFGYLDPAKDIAQQVALGAYRRMSDFKEREHFNRWIMAKAHWLALDELRLSKRQVALWSGETKLLKTQPSQENITILEEIFKIIAGFPSQQRLALLRSFEGYSTSEIAAELSVTPATVRSLRRHARYRLFEELNK